MRKLFTVGLTILSIGTGGIAYSLLKGNEARESAAVTCMEKADTSERDKCMKDITDKVAKPKVTSS